MVAPASVQYVNANPGDDPAVTAGAVRLIVAGAHTAAGLVIRSEGVGFTTIFLLAVAAIHGPPLVVRVNVAVPLYAAGGVHVAFSVVAVGLKVPPAGVDQVPPVADPPTEPPNAVEVPPWQIAAIAPPGLAVGIG